MAITGGCLCGAVRYTAHEKPIATRVCWCRLCQYLGAGSGTVNTIFPTASLEITGELRDFQSTADSGNIMHRQFCPQCGTQLFSAAVVRPQWIIVRVGTLDDPDVVEPQSTIWAASAPSWAVIDLDIPCLDGQPPPVA